MWDLLLLNVNNWFKKFKHWIGHKKHLCRPDLAMGCQFVTFDLEPGQCGLSGYLGSALTALDCLPAWFCSHRASKNAPALHFWHHIWLRSCLLTISNFGPPRCLISCQSTCLFYLPVNLVFCVHLGSVAWMGACMLTNACFTVWIVKSNTYFHPWYRLTSHSACVIFWECMVGFLLWYFFSASGCQFMLTTVKAPSVYTIPRSPWNYRILWACFSLGIQLHLERGWQSCGCLDAFDHIWSHLIPA